MTTRRLDLLRRPATLVAIVALLLVAWVGVTAGRALLHGHPLYGALLAATAVGAAVVLARARRPRAGRRRVVTVVLVVLAASWLAALASLRPFPAREPALAALRSDAAVTVREEPTRIVLSPTGAARRIGLLYQPGARVDPVAYAALLRPLAAAGHPVVVVKQPLGIGFLAPVTTGTVSNATVTGEPMRWVVGGHSLGGTVAALQAASGEPFPVAGLVLHASYPAGDASRLALPVLSVAASRDALATPDKIAGSRALLPAETTFVTIEGAVHASFGDYGPQPGDGEASLPADEARSAITTATLRFVDTLER